MDSLQREYINMALVVSTVEDSTATVVATAAYNSNK